MPRYFTRPSLLKGFSDDTENLASTDFHEVSESPLTLIVDDGGER